MIAFDISPLSDLSLGRINLACRSRGFSRQQQACQQCVGCAYYFVFLRDRCALFHEAGFVYDRLNHESGHILAADPQHVLVSGVEC